MTGLQWNTIQHTLLCYVHLAETEAVNFTEAYQFRD